MTPPLVVAAVAFGASLLGSLSGGSSSMVTTPAWIALGAPFATAVAADKVAGSLWTLAASRTYLRGRVMDRQLLLGMGVAGLVGAALGAEVVTAIDETVLRRGAGVVILVTLVLSLRPVASDGRGGATLGRSLLTLLALPLGFYEGVLGSGNGVVTTLLLQRARRLDLLAALGHYYALAAAWCGLAAVVYLAHGVVAPGLTIPATIGAIAGGATGSRIGRARGTVLVRPLFVGLGLVLAARLIAGP